jgi:hypothetical protein
MAPPPLDPARASRVGSAAMVRHFSAYGLCMLGVGAVSCATYHDDLQRGQTAFEHNSHEEALAIFRALEVDTGHLSPAERAQYAYLRGMTDFRIGYKPDARHWLLVARALEDRNPGQLPADWALRMDEAIASLNDEVFAGGAGSLQTAPTSTK